MILHPAVLALSAGSLVVTFMVLSAAFYGVKILKHWDLKSGSELQLNLERQTYLISTIMSYAFGFQLFSLFLFIFTADKLAGLFTGAMCAAGTLNVNGFGYPALLFKIINFILGGVWLIVNYTDNRAIDYPLIKKKYAFLLVVAPFILVEMVLQGAYFLNLDAHVITSCCGSLFSPEGKGIGALFRFNSSDNVDEDRFLCGCHSDCDIRVFVLQPRQAGNGLFLCIHEHHNVRRIGVRAYFIYFPLFLSITNAPLPLLHPPEGILLCRLPPLCYPPRRCRVRCLYGRAPPGEEYSKPPGTPAGD